MLKALFGLNSDTPELKHAALLGNDGKLMVDFLCSAASLMPFKESEAKIAATYMSTQSYRRGEIIIEEASRTRLDFMLWILEGEATFEAITGGGVCKPVTVRLLGPGAEVGTMSMFDGEPRALRGTASTSLRCAKLTRSQLQSMCQEYPQVGVKLMAVICLNFAMTLRELTTKFKVHVRLNNALNAELMGKDSANLRQDNSL